MKKRNCQKTARQWNRTLVLILPNEIEMSFVLCDFVLNCSTVFFSICRPHWWRQDIYSIEGAVLGEKHTVSQNCYCILRSLFTVS